MVIMTLKHIRKNIELLKFIGNCKNKKLLHNLLENLNPNFLYLLKQLISNILLNPNINITAKHKKKLFVYKNILRKIVKQKNSESLKKSYNKINQKGGFAFLIPTLLSLVPLIASTLFK